MLYRIEYKYNEQGPYTLFKEKAAHAPSPYHTCQSLIPPPHPKVRQDKDRKSLLVQKQITHTYTT